VNRPLSKAALAIIEYIGYRTSVPCLGMRKFQFEGYSYEVWAAEEILELVMNNPEESPSDLIEDFGNKMSYFACIAKTRKARLTFKTARDIADDLLFYITYESPRYHLYKGR